MKDNGLFTRENGTKIAYIPVSRMFLWHQMDLTGTAVKVYSFLMWQAEEAGNLSVKISVKKLCEGTGVKQEETVRRGIRQLISKGWISKIETEIDNSLTYTINLEKKSPNLNLIKWLEDRSTKNSENSKKMIKDGKIIKDEKGKFQKADKGDSKDED